MKLKKIITSIIAILLVTATVATTLDYSHAAATEQVWYVSEVAIGTYKELKSKGYKVDLDSSTGRYKMDDTIYKNGNQSNVYGNGVCIGYKLSWNKEDAITDLAVMDMYGAYSKLTYKDVLSGREEEIKTLADNIQTVAKQFAENYKNGNTYTAAALKTLNYIVVPAEGDRAEAKLGDYLIDTARTEDDFTEIVFESSTIMVSLIYALLTLGVSDDLTQSGSKSWIKELCENGPIVAYDEDNNIITDSGDLNQYYKDNYDNTYMQRAAKIYDSIKSFAESYVEAKTAYEKNKDDKITSEEAAAAAEKAYDDVSLNYTTDDTEETDAEEQCEQAVVMGIYNKLDSKDEAGNYIYPYTDSSIMGSDEKTSLAQFIVKIGTMTVTEDNSTDIYRALYPFIAEQNGVTPLNRSQELMMEITGIDTAITYAFDAFDLDEAIENCEDAAEEMTESNGGEAVSVWFNVDKDMYNEDADIYWTSDASRVISATSRYDLLTEPAKTNVTTKDKVKKALMIMSSAYTIVSLTSSIVSGIAFLATGETVATIIAAYGTAKAASYSAVSIAVAFGVQVLEVVSVVVMVVMVLVALGLAIYEMFHQPDYDLDYTKMPEIIYDLGETGDFDSCVLKYYAVKAVGVATSPNEKTSNIYSFYQDNTCCPWVGVYYTKDTDAGNPITATVTANGHTLQSVKTKPFKSYYSGRVMDASDELDVTDLCIESVSDSAIYYEQNAGTLSATLRQISLDKYSDAEMTDENFQPVHEFGILTAYNFAYYGNEGFNASDDEKLEYLNFAKTLNWYMRQEPVVRGNNTSKYISDVKLISSTDEKTAELEAQKMGYTLVAGDLTSDSSVHTFICYKTNPKASNAIKDLRVAYAVTSDPDSLQINYGGNSYGCCGHVGNLCLLESGGDNCTAGTPILTIDEETLKCGLQVVTSRSNATEGYEPVNLFCGGPAFDFNSGNTWQLGNGYGKEDDADWNSSAYIYFLPQTTYTSGEEYIGGLAFFSGENVDEYIEYSGWTKLATIDENGESTYVDLSGHQYDKLHKATQYLDNPRDTNGMVTYLCYSTTYNPYRAIYDITYYECEPNASTVGYNVAVGSNGYVACDIFQQGGTGYLDSDDRSVRISHSYRSASYYDGTYKPGKDNEIDTEVYKNVFGEICTSGTLSNTYGEMYELEDGTIAYRDITCVGLYVTGYSATGKPIKAGELYSTTTTSYNSKTTTPVRSMTDWYSETGVNLAYEEDFGEDWNTYLTENFKYPCTEKMYLYINRADETKGAFVSSVTVAYSGDMETVEGQLSTPVDNAVRNLVKNGKGQLIKVNLCGDNGIDDIVTVPYTFPYNLLNSESPTNYATYVYEKNREILGDDDGGYYYYGQGEFIQLQSYTYTNQVAYIWVTYSNATTGNFGDLRVLTTTGNTSDKDITITGDDGTSEIAATRCGDGFRIDDSDTYYFLYAIYSTGTQIKEFSVSEQVFEKGKWTSTSTENKAPGYTKYFFHLKPRVTLLQKNYISNILTATGKTETEAQLGLLDLGCRMACPFNINPDVGDPIYMGYAYTSKKANAYSKLIIKNCEQKSNIVQINAADGQYNRIVTDLNSGVYDSIIGLYGKKEKSPTRVVANVLFWTDKELLNCFQVSDEELAAMKAREGNESKKDSALKELVLAEKVNAYLEKVKADSEEDYEYLKENLFAENGKVLSYDMITTSMDTILDCNLGAQYFAKKGQSVSSVYLFVNYSDNYTRDLETLEANTAAKTGSIFSKGAMVWIISSGAAVLLLACAAIFLVLKKKAKAKVKSPEEETADGGEIQNEETPDGGEIQKEETADGGVIQNGEIINGGELQNEETAKDDGLPGDEEPKE